MNSVWPKDIKEHPIPIYGSAVYFVKSRDKWDACMAAIDLDQDVSGCAGICIQCANKDGRCIHIVGVFDGQTQTLVHEIGHLAFHILGRAGVPIIDDAANEAYCYVLDAMFALAQQTLKLKE